MTLAQHPAEVADELFDGPQGRTAVQDAGEVGLFGFAAVDGGADDPAGDGAGFR